MCFNSLFLPAGDALLEPLQSGVFRETRKVSRTGLSSVEKDDVINGTLSSRSYMWQPCGWQFNGQFASGASRESLVSQFREEISRRFAKTDLIGVPNDQTVL